LRRFARTCADGDIDASSSAGREFVFADFVKDKRVLNAARMMCGSASGASASGQGIMLDQATSSTTRMAQEDESFLLRTAVTHGILRLRKKGWLVLADEQRDAYLYVGTAEELAVPILDMMRQLGQEIGFDHLEMTLDDILLEAQRHAWLRIVGMKSIEGALEYLVAQSLVHRPSNALYVLS